MLALGGCAEAPLSALAPAGAAAGSIATVWWVMAAGSLVLLAGMVALSLYAASRRRAVIGRAGARALLLGGGLALPLVVIAALLVYGIRSGHALLPLGGDAFRVEVTAHQWWWEVRYPDFEGAALVDANEIHIPAGRPVDVHVTARDVIHGFWVPRLGGKIDALPGRVNVIRLEADRAGVYRGQCAEFCGAQHSRMGFRVIAHEGGAFEDRLSELADAGPDIAAAPRAWEGCAGCHSVDARDMDPRPAPNLAGLSRRTTLGAGWLDNDPDNLRRWLRHHQAIKPGNRMPDHGDLDDADVAALARFLEGER